MKNSIKNEIKERYSQIVTTGNATGCCTPGECCTADSPMTVTRSMGYEQKELESIPSESILGLGCGAPLVATGLQEGETVVDLGSGAGIDAFLASKQVRDSGMVYGIDMTDKMLDKARENASKGGYRNVEFKKGDIEKRIPLDDDFADAVISNCVINLTMSKIDAFREAYRILKTNGRMVISDLVADREIAKEEIDSEQWCKCIDGASTRQKYLSWIRQAGFKDIEILKEQTYLEEANDGDGRSLISLVIRAIK